MERGIPLLCLVLTASTAFFACSARVEGSFRTEGSAELSLSAALEPKMSALIRSLSGEGGTGTVIDAAAVAASLKAAPGVSGALLSNSAGSDGLRGGISVSDVNALFRVSGAASLIRYERNGSGGRLSIRLDRESGPLLLSHLSPDVADYLAALMAPIATGEALSVADYLDEVSAVYGSGISKEIAAARITLFFSVPGPVVSASGGTFSGKRAEFDLPLAEFLVLAAPITLEIQWT